MEDYVTHNEHREFASRMDAANKDMSRRIGVVESAMGRIETIATATERLATTMEHMLAEQKDQGQRLSVIEGRDGDLWRKTVGYAITAVIGVLIGYVATHLGF